MNMDIVKAGRATPTKLSEWIVVAVEDSRRIPACSTSNYQFVPDMSTFNRPGITRCRACFAGMAMLGTGIWSPAEGYGWSLNPIANALNSVRAGDIREALRSFLSTTEEGVGLLPKKVKAAAERVEDEARLAYISDKLTGGDLAEEELIDAPAGWFAIGVLTDYPTKDCRASDEAYLELAAALKEVGL